MRILPLVLAIAALSLCLRIPAQNAENMRPWPDQSADRGQVSTDIDDSDLFFQNTIRPAGPQRDNSQKIEALLKRMTLEEKVGQMTQLAIGMIATGQDQTIQIDPAKLDKAVVRYSVGSIRNVHEKALTPDKWYDIIGQTQEAATK